MLNRRFVAGLALVFIVAEVAARLVMSTAPESIRWYDASTQLKVAQMDEIADVDVVFAGTSMAWQAFDAQAYTERTGRSSYNAGLNGGTPEVMERWLLEEVEPRTNPETVIWGLSSLDLAPNYGPAQRMTYDDALATKSGRLAAVEQSVSGWSTLIADRAVLRDLNALVGHDADEREQLWTYAEANLGPAGERLDFSVDLDERRREVLRARLRDFDPVGKETADLQTIREVINALQRRNVEVVLVHLPTPQRMIETLPRGSTDHRAAISAMAGLAVEADVRFLEMSDLVEDDAFVDYSHLNSEGVQVFVEAFVDAMGSDRDDRVLDGTIDVSPVSDEVNGPNQPDCVSEVIIDDYGFEVEISSCPQPEEEPEVDAEALEELGLAVAPAVWAATVERDRLCQAGLSPVAGLDAIAVAVDRAVAAASETPPAQQQFLAGVILPIATRPSTCTPSADPAIAAATAGITGALDRMAGARTENPERASAFWGSNVQLRVAAWIRHALDEAIDVDAVIIGNSVPLTGIDAGLLGAATGETVGQASIAGVTPEAIGPWLDEIIPLVGPDRVYWGISYWDLYALCYVEPRAEKWRDDSAFRMETFADLVDLEARRRWDHLFGATGVDAYGDSPILATIDVPVYEQGLGQSGIQTDAVADDDALARSVAEAETALWRVDEPCLERAPYLAAEVARLQADGREVVLVVLPPNPVFADQHPLGVDGYFAAADELVAGAGADQVIVLDLGLSGDKFTDGIHFLPQTRQEVMEALVTDLDLAN